MMFFTDELDGVGTVGVYHYNGETETVLVTGDKDMADLVVKGLNEFMLKQQGKKS